MVHAATIEAEAAERAHRRRRRRRRMPSWAHGPAYVGIRALVATMRAGEMAQSVQRARELAGWFARASFNRRRLNRAMVNLGVAFPDWPEHRRYEYAVNAYEHLFMLAVETSYMPALLTEDGWAAHVRLGEMSESMEHLLAERPCLLVTGHCGSWELLGYMMALLGFPMHALYRPLDLRPLDAWMRRTRRRAGLYLVDKFGAATKLPEVLGRNGAVGFVADQNGGDRGVFVPFFGRLASAYKTIGLLAQQYRAPVICGHARRLVWERDGEGAQAGSGASVGFRRWRGEPFRYELSVADVIRPEDWADRRDPLYYITARYRRAIETMVRRAPEQYLWMHRYWKSRPRHERLGRAFPDSLRQKIEDLPWMTETDVQGVIEWSRRDAEALAREHGPVV